MSRSAAHHVALAEVTNALNYLRNKLGMSSEVGIVGKQPFLTAQQRSNHSPHITSRQLTSSSAPLYTTLSKNNSLAMLRSPS
jgi:hypothetical protein